MEAIRVGGPGVSLREIETLIDRPAGRLNRPARIA